jgi:hypothetical protein
MVTGPRSRRSSGPWKYSARPAIASRWGLRTPRDARRRERGSRLADYVLDETLFHSRRRTTDWSPGCRVLAGGKLYIHLDAIDAATVPNVARMVGIDPSQVVLIAEYCGGGFGAIRGPSTWRSRPFSRRRRTPCHTGR